MLVGAARAYVTHSVHAREAVSRWYYLGPMFRAEQPQRGRDDRRPAAGGGAAVDSVREPLYSTNMCSPRSDENGPETNRNQPGGLS